MGGQGAHMHLFLRRSFFTGILVPNERRTVREKALEAGVRGFPIATPVPTFVPSLLLLLRSVCPSSLGPSLRPSPSPTRSPWPCVCLSGLSLPVVPCLRVDGLWRSTWMPARDDGVSVSPGSRNGTLVSADPLPPAPRTCLSWVSLPQPWPSSPR